MKTTNDDVNVLTVTPGGHVFAGTWEQRRELDTARCAACGEELAATMAPGLCDGWKEGAPEDVLERLVRGLIREASDDGPNGPTEGALAFWAALDELEEPFIGSDEIARATRDVRAGFSTLATSMADDARALRLAYEARRRPVEALQSAAQLALQAGNAPSGSHAEAAVRAFFEALPSHRPGQEQGPVRDAFGRMERAIEETVETGGGLVELMVQPVLVFLHPLHRFQVRSVQPTAVRFIMRGGPPSG